ncbi:unnamed protein product [Rotaria socialis]|nr:unnamed protein product [Rotaria socialis]CAF4098220.1 unnamed protein product [Rotaria socialis]
MIRCDELVDVSADIKEKRKEMIRNVEKVIGQLESKVPQTPVAEQNSNPMETATTSISESLSNTKNKSIQETIENSSSSLPQANVSSSIPASTEQSTST